MAGYDHPHYPGGGRGGYIGGASGGAGGGPGAYYESERMAPLLTGYPSTAGYAGSGGGGGSYGRSYQQ